MTVMKALPHKAEFNCTHLSMLCHGPYSILSSSSIAAVGLFSHVIYSPTKAHVTLIKNASGSKSGSFDRAQDCEHNGNSPAKISSIAVWLDDFLLLHI